MCTNGTKNSIGINATSRAFSMMKSEVRTLCQVTSNIKNIISSYRI